MLDLLYFPAPFELFCRDCPSLVKSRALLCSLVAFATHHTNCFNERGTFFASDPASLDAYYPSRALLSSLSRLRPDPRCMHQWRPRHLTLPLNCDI